VTARWETLETAEEVVAAFEAGRTVHFMAADDPVWVDVTTFNCPPEHVTAELSEGHRYRAMIEDSK
jgi:hypothetical protein